MARNAAQSEKRVGAGKPVDEERRWCRRQVESRPETKAMVLRSAGSRSVPGPKQAMMDGGWNLGLAGSCVIILNGYSREWVE
jgi:hypothetical protein